MATRTVSERDEARGGDGAAAEGEEAFNGGRMWIGRHAADGDTLVFDPALSDATAANLSFFSLTQFRQRAFPRRVVSEKIQEITDQAQYAEALEQYRGWPALKDARTQERAAANVRTAERQKEEVVERHRQLLEAQDLPYQGVRDSQGGGRRRTRCGVCGIGLDDFAGTECVACGGVLCSCGACGCKLRPRRL